MASGLSMVDRNRMAPHGLAALGFVAALAMIGARTDSYLAALGIGRGAVEERPPLIDDFVGPLDVVGINVSKHRTFQTNYPFVNAMRQSSSWRTSSAGGAEFDTGFALRIENLGLLDADGYPLYLPVPPSDFPSIALAAVTLETGVNIFGEDSGSYAIVHAPSHGHVYAYGEKIELFDAGQGSLGLFTITSADDDRLEIWAPGGVGGVPESAVVTPPPAAPQTMNTSVFANNGETYPAGRYVLLYDGVGTFSFDAGGEFVEDLSAPGRLVIDLAHHENGLRFTIESSQQGDHVRNIRLMQEAFEQVAAPTRPVFHPDYIGLIADLAGPIRVMDWLDTNVNQQVDWDDRRLPSRYTQALESSGAERGVAWELLVALANESQRDLWICVPHRATADYIQRLAELLRDQLDPALRVWVEYTNEAWNDDFAAWHWIDSGQIRRQVDPRANTYDPDLTWQGNIPEGYDSGSFSALATHARYGAFASRVFEIFEAVFGENEMGMQGRVVRVLAGHMSRPERLEEAIPECPEFDVASIACYFSPTSVDQDALVDLGSAVTSEDVYEAISLNRMPRQKSKMEGQVRALSRLGLSHLPVIAYEGGQALNAPRSADDLHAVYLQMQREQRLADMYVEMIRSFQAIGLDGLIAYNLDSGGWTNGFWGHLQGSFDDQGASQKWGALRTLERGFQTGGLHQAGAIEQGLGSGGAWSSPEQAGAGNNLYATVALTAGDPTSAPLRLTEFGRAGSSGWRLPKQGDFTGMIVRVQARAASGAARVREIRTGVGNVEIVSIPIQDHLFDGTERTFDLGEHDVLMGSALSLDDIRNPGFFIEVEWERDGAGDVDLRVDLVSAAVFSTAPVGESHACAGDLDGDGQIGASDVAELLARWGQKGPVGDLNESGQIDAADLASIIGRWGVCAPSESSSAFLE